MKEKAPRSDEGSVEDLLHSLRSQPRQFRPAGRLKQLNKHAKKMKRMHNPFIETDGPSQS